MTETTYHQSKGLSSRDDRLDRARIILIWCVVFGHLLELFLGAHRVFDATYIYIYSFHMPAFVMLAGMTSRAELSPKALTSLKSKIITPLLLFMVLYEVFHFYVTGRISVYITNAAPYWVLWFLMSLFVWRLTLPYLLKLRHPILFSFFLAIIAGLFNAVDFTLSVSRTLYFLPFFLIGHLLYKGKLSLSFDALMSRVNFAMAIFWLLALGAILYLLAPLITPTMLYGSTPYAKLGPNIMQMMSLRMTILFLSLISAIVVIRLAASLPKMPAIIAANSLWIYLWHGFFIVFAKYASTVTDFAQPTEPISVVIALAGCALLAWFMCSILSRACIARWSASLVAMPSALRSRIARS